MSLQVWLPLDGDTHNQGISLLPDPTVNTFTFSDEGKIGKSTSGNGKIAWHLTEDILGNEWSVAVWIKATHAFASANNIIFCKNTSASNDCQIYFSIVNGASLHVGVNGPASSLSQSYTFAVGTWYHVAATYDGNTASLYINGEFKKSTTVTTAWPGAKLNMQLRDRSNNAAGTGSGGSAAAAYAMNDFRLYNHALSRAEVKQIAQGLILHYKLNDEFIVSVSNLTKGASCGSCYSATSLGTWGGHKYYATVGPTTPNDTVPFTQKTVFTLTYDTSVGTGGGGSVYPPTSFKVKPSTTYTYSRYIKPSDNFTYVHANFLYRYEYQDSGGTRLIEAGIFNKNNTEYVGNGWYRCWGTFTTQANTAYLSLPFYTYPNKNIVYELGGLQLEESNHITPYIERLNNYTTENLVIGLTAGGRTTVSGLTVTTAGTDQDTYFYLNLSSAMILNHTYKLTCEASGLPNGAYLNFPIASQSNTTIPLLKIANGYNECIFRANTVCVNGGVKIILDDAGGTRTSVITMNNFSLIDVTPTIVDSSGFGNNGILIGEFLMNNNSPRYDKSLKLNSLAPTTNEEKGISYIQTPFGLTTPSQITIAWWGKPESGYTGSHSAFCTSSLDTYPTDYNTTALHHRDGGFDIYTSDSIAKRLSFSYPQNEWHHYAITYDGTTAKSYKDGVQSSSVEVGAGKLLASFTNLYIGFSKGGSVWRKTLGSYSDFRVYCTCLLDNDVKQLYNTSMKVDKKENALPLEIIETNKNLMWKPNFAIADGVMRDGAGRYTQSHCSVTYTPEGVHIVRDANLTQANDGSVMYGGIVIYNTTNASVHVYDPTIDNNLGLIKNHTYIWVLHVKGNSTNNASFAISNNFGWGGGGLSPTPTNTSSVNIGSNFNGEKDIYYKFTISDDIAKTCTSSYASFVVDNVYLSYKAFGWYWGYGSTGDGTDIYITNVRLYDITNLENTKITKTGLLKANSLFEINEDIKVQRNNTVIANQFIER